jgi:ubiquinone/menaquinone biosynthesis C-methylase UbiE
MRAAYGTSSDAWAAGPERVYAALAAALVAHSPVPLVGRTVLDVGAGTGVASRVLRRHGARPVGVDVAAGMLAYDRAARPPGVVGDAAALPFRTGSVEGAVYACSLSHVAEPAVALREAARVVAPGGVVLASVLAAGADPPEKARVETVLRRHGWSRPAWYDALKRRTEPALATPERLADCAVAAGLAEATATVAQVNVPMDAADVVAWRLGMPQVAPYVAGLAEEQRAALSDAVLDAVAGPPRLVRVAVVLLACRR